jgi:hypothetical protein
MTTRDGWDGIFFLLDGKEYAFRNWKHVPRKGDWVVFAPADKPFEVLRVIWRENRSPPDAAYAEVVIKRIKQR